MATFREKKIIITGHTGFKGSWLSSWLKKLGAKLYGVSSYIPSNPSMYEVINHNLFEKEMHFFSFTNSVYMSFLYRNIYLDFDMNFIK